MQADQRLRAVDALSVGVIGGLVVHLKAPLIQPALHGALDLPPPQEIAEVLPAEEPAGVIAGQGAVRHVEHVLGVVDVRRDLREDRRRGQHQLAVVMAPGPVKALADLLREGLRLGAVAAHQGHHKGVRRRLIDQIAGDVPQEFVQQQHRQRSGAGRARETPDDIRVLDLYADRMEALPVDQQIVQIHAQGPAVVDPGLRIEQIVLVLHAQQHAEIGQRLAEELHAQVDVHQLHQNAAHDHQEKVAQGGAPLGRDGLPRAEEVHHDEGEIQHRAGIQEGLAPVAGEDHVFVVVIGPVVEGVGEHQKLRQQRRQQEQQVLCPVEAPENAGDADDVIAQHGQHRGVEDEIEVLAELHHEAHGRGVQPVRVQKGAERLRRRIEQQAQQHPEIDLVLQLVLAVLDQGIDHAGQADQKGGDIKRDLYGLGCWHSGILLTGAGPGQKDTSLYKSGPKKSIDTRPRVRTAFFFGQPRKTRNDVL